MRYLYFSLILPVFLVSACQDSTPGVPPQEPGQLVSATQTEEFSYQQLRMSAALLDFDDLTDILNHDVAVYRVGYRTCYRGDVTEAAGLHFVAQQLQGTRSYVS